MFRYLARIIQINEAAKTVTIRDAHFGDENPLPYNMLEHEPHIGDIVILPLQVQFIPTTNPFIAVEKQ